MNVAVCVCTCGRPALLDRLLGALRYADFNISEAGAVELVVIDNFPDGRARAVCERHAAALPVVLHFFEESRRGISFARNRAIEEALGRGAALIAFIDDDDLPQPDWLARLVDKQRDTGADIVAGIWRSPDDLRVPGYLSEVKVFAQLDFDRRSLRYDLWPCATCNVLIARRAIELMADVQGQIFRPEFALIGGGDTDFFIRAYRTGAKMIQAKDSVVIKQMDGARATLGGVLTYAFRKGCARMRIAAVHCPRKLYAKLRWRAAKRILKSAAQLSPFSAARSVAVLYEIADAAGELYAAFGGQYAYYYRRSLH